MASLPQRMIRAAKLESALYEEVEADKGAMAQATAAVIISSLAAGIGTGRGGFMNLIMGTVAALLAWYIWSFLTYIIGTKVLPEAQTSADYGQLLRTIGFSSSPGVIRVLGIVPGLYAPVFMVASVWMMIAMLIAVRQALDYQSTWRALAVVLIGWLVQVVILMVFMAIVGAGLGLMGRAGG